MKLPVLLFWVGACAACGVAGYGLAHRPNRDNLANAAIARVNGEAITRQEMDLKLLLFRDQALEQLVELKLLEKEAGKLGLKVAPESSELDPMSRAQAQQARAQKLIRAIVLKQAGESVVKDLYDTCKSELALYDVSVMLFNDKESEESALDKLQHRAKFSDTAHSYSQDIQTRSKDGRVGWITLPDLKARYGPYLAEAAEGLKDNQVSRPVPAPFGTMIVMVHARKTSLDQLRDSVESALVEARTTELLARLARKAVVTP